MRIPTRVAGALGATLMTALSLGLSAAAPAAAAAGAPAQSVRVHAGPARPGDTWVVSRLAPDTITPDVLR